MPLITRFRIEAVGTDKDKVVERMSEAVSEIARALRQNGDRGHWECIDDVISQEKSFVLVAGKEKPRPTGRYSGRMVMKFMEYDEPRELNGFEIEQICDESD